jgi:hypothetical protein
VQDAVLAQLVLPGQLFQAPLAGVAAQEEVVLREERRQGGDLAAGAGERLIGRE